MTRRNPTVLKSSEQLQWVQEVRQILPGDGPAMLVAAALLHYLNRKTGQCNPSYETLSRDCGFEHRDRARRAVKRLRAAGLVDYRETYGGARQNTNWYTLTRCTSAPRQAPAGKSKAPPTRCTTTPGAPEHPVHRPPLYPVHQCTTEPIGEPDTACDPLEAGSQSVFTKDKPVRTEEEKAFALAQIADLRKSMVGDA